MVLVGKVYLVMRSMLSVGCIQRKYWVDFGLKLIKIARNNLDIYRYFSVNVVWAPPLFASYKGGMFW